jgi:hypothetical protein
MMRLTVTYLSPSKSFWSCMNGSSVKLNHERGRVIKAKESRVGERAGKAKGKRRKQH